MKTKQDVIKTAVSVRKNAYAPYSDFRVGASVLSTSGKIFSGCNVENASYGLTICAERNALAAAIASGEKNFELMVIASPNGVAPCGACRQVIWELCGDIPIILIDNEGNQTKTASSSLLPEPFDQNDLS